jgi:DedD protein
MGLFSLLKRKDVAATPGATGSADEVRQARTRARRRLIGAAVLLGAGIVGFPLLFESQPRPIPVNINIEIPNKDSVPPLASPSPRPDAARGEVARADAASAVSEPEAEAAKPASAATPTTPASAIAALPAPKAAPEAAKPAPKPASASASAPKPEPKAEPAAKPGASEAARARALLEGQSSTKVAGADKASQGTSGGRYVVQVGAFADAGAAQDTRTRVERLGLKTYTQVIDTDNGKRTRVRVGPFSSREEADKAAGRITAAGLPSSVLSP